jgi:hypothetical protein
MLSPKYTAKITQTRGTNTLMAFLISKKETNIYSKMTRQPIEIQTNKPKTHMLKQEGNQ